MAFFPSSSPSYKTAGAQPMASSGSSLLGSMLGGTTPAYKTLDGQSAQAPATGGLIRIFIGAPPSYKTAPAVVVSDGDADDTDDADDACPATTDTVVVL